MSNNIYSIPAWTTTTFFIKNSIVYNGSYYYYALVSHTSSSDFNTDLSSGYWGGIISDKGEVKPHFIWNPSYKPNTLNEPRIKKIEFGDGYVQRVSDGINNILPVTDYTFEGLDLDTCTAILHFLEMRRGVESFVFIPPAPRGIISRFVCEKWSDSINFYNNYNINAQFTRSTV